MIELDLAPGTTEAQVTEMCEKLLANTVIESYRVEIRLMRAARLTGWRAALEIGTVPEPDLSEGRRGSRGSGLRDLPLGLARLDRRRSGGAAPMCRATNIAASSSRPAPRCGAGAWATG